MKFFRFLWLLKIILFVFGDHYDVLISENEECEKLSYRCYMCANGNVFEDGCRTCRCLTIIDGEIVQWGEIELTSNQAKLLLPHDFMGAALARAGTKAVVKKWDNLPLPGGFYRIPFFLEDKPVISAKARQVIQRAISALSSQTCIRFEPARVGDKSMIRFNSSKGCGSFVGRTEGIRTIQGCTRSVGEMLKAIMYALGFWGEVMRGDRDNYVTFMPINMKQSKVHLTMKLNPDLWDNYSFAYDFSSVTHLGPLAYSAFGGTTVLYKNNPREPLKINRWAFSLGDLQQIRAMYNCSGVRGQRNTSSCQSKGDKGLTYRGTINVTKSGVPCQRWDSQNPHSHSMNPSLLTASDLKENFCRNPDMKERPWCFTTSNSLRWEYCNITVCNDSETLLPMPTPLTSRRGFWSAWSNFSSCTTTCGRGFRYSIRRCVGSVRGSARCPGNYFRYETCNSSGCPFTDRWHSWEKWSECPAACGSANRTRVRFCVGNVGKGTCVNQSVETEPCNTGRTCPLYQGGECYNPKNPGAYRGSINVDKDGNTCLNWTDAKINITAYPNAGLTENYCRNPDDRRKVPYCFRLRNNRNICNITKCNIVASWYKWEPWSACSTTCGNGTKTKTRRCKKGHYGDWKCKGKVISTAPCNGTCDNRTLVVIIDEVRPPQTKAPMPTTTPSIVECLDAANPRSYRGTRRWSKSGHKCQYWDANYPWTHNYTNPTLIAKAGLLENFCRTPDPGDVKPWCFVQEFIPKKEECDVPFCPYSSNLPSMFAHLWAEFLNKFGLVP